MKLSAARTALIAEIGVLALLYFVTARLGQLLAIPPGNITPVWIPSGIILAAVLTRGYRVWPGIFLGAFAGNVWAYFSTASGGALLRCVLAGTVNGMGDTLGAVISAYLITKATGGRDPLGQAADVVKFVVLGGILGSGISAVCGVTALGLVGFVSWHAYVASLVTWWIGDCVGVLVVAPLLLAWRAGWQGCRFGREEVLFMVVLPTASLGSLLLFPAVPGLIILPLLLWAVFRFDRRVLLAGIALEAVLVTVMAAMGHGPFAHESPNNGLVQLQLFLALMTVPMLVLCGALTENTRVQDCLLALNRELSERVKDRTRRLEAELGERTRAEAQATSSARLLQTVIDHSQCFIYAKDLAGRFILASQPLAEFFGQPSPARLLGHTSHDFLPAAIAEQHRINDLQVAARRAPLLCEETTGTAADARTYLSTKFPLLDVAGQMYAMCGVSIDITQRKQAEEDLQSANTALREAVLQHETALEQLRVHQTEMELQNEELRAAQVELDAARERYFDLYDQAPVGYVTLSDTGLILESNLTAATLLDTVRSVLVTRPLSHFILKEDQDIYYRHLKQLLATSSRQVLELRMLSKAGHSFWVRLDATVAQDTGGAPVCRVTLSDISAIKKTEDELLKLLKLQSVGTLAGGIAHDFNNILMGLFGNISLAKIELAKEHPSHTLLEEAETSMNRAVRLTKQLLTFAKGGDPVKECVSLGALIEEVAKFDLSGSNVSLLYQQAPDLWQAEADRGQIQQVVSNIIINARQAMPGGGHLHISLENAFMPAGAMVGLPAGNYVKITIRDEGTGIEAKHLDRVFEPYFTTRPAGHGLGLATAYSIIHKHGGHISVGSELGKGTTFTLYLPAANLPQPAEPEPPAVASSSMDRRANILVMDDEAVVRTIITLMLKSCGFTAATASDGHEAIALYRQALEAGAPFDAVIMDLTIPGGMGGEEAVKNLLALDPHAKVIVSSGYADDPVMANYADYGFKGIATKPYTISELQAVLARVLQRDPANIA